MIKPHGHDPAELPVHRRAGTIDPERVLALWRQGLSAREIGRRLQGSREMPFQANSVLRVVERLRSELGDRRVRRRR